MLCIGYCGSRTIRSEQGLDGVLGRRDVVVVDFCNLPRLEIDTRSPGGGIADLWAPLRTYGNPREPRKHQEWVSIHLCH